MVQLVLIHGVGGPNPTSEWLEPLNTRLEQLGFGSTISERADTIIAPDYSGLFGSTDAPVVADTYKAPDEKVLFQQRLDYALRQKALERAVRLHHERSDVLGFMDVPLGVANSSLVLVEQFGFQDATRFRQESAVRNAIWRHVISKMPNSGPVIIIAHSLGSVVAAGLLRRLPPRVTVELLVTIGSPLPFPRYRSPLAPLSSDFPYSRVLRWLNVYSPWDAITGGRGLSAAMGQVVDVCTHIDGDHALEAYMSCPAVAAAVGSVAFGTESDSEIAVAGGAPPARRMHDSWRPLLIGTAFTWQLSKSLPSGEWRAHRRLEAARDETARRAVDDIEIKRRRRTDSIKQLREMGATVKADEVDDHPLADGRYPTFRDLTVGAAALLHGTWNDEELVSFAVGLMIQPLVAPFDIQANLQRRTQALELTLNVVRTQPGNLAHKTYAERVRKSVEWAQDRLKDSKAFPWGTVLVGTGLVLLAATGVGLAVAAPAGLYGAAVVTSTLAAFGPGGMVGGLLTLAALTGTVGGLGTLGVAIELDESARPGAQAAAAAESGIELAAADVETLRVTLAGMLAVVHAQSGLDFESTEPLVRIVLDNALDTAHAEHRIHAEIAPDTKGTTAWVRKVTLLERALSALDTLTTPLPQLEA